MRRFVRDVICVLVVLGMGWAMGSAWAQVTTQEDPHKIIRQQLMEYAAAVANLQVALRECQAQVGPLQPTVPKGQEKK